MTKKGKTILGIVIGAVVATGTILLLTNKAAAAAITGGMTKDQAIKIILDSPLGNNPAQPYITKDYLNSKDSVFVIAWASAVQRNDIDFNYQGALYSAGSGDSLNDIAEGKI